MKSKKSKFWTFWLSFIPGCAEMYMGFMKMGLSLAGAFWGIVVISTMLRVGALMYLTFIVWIYSFFHAKNIYHLEQEEFDTMEDEYLFHINDIFNISDNISEKVRKVIAVLLVVFGVTFLMGSVSDIIASCFPIFWNNWMPVYNMICDVLPRFLVGILIIGIGVFMIRGKKRQLLEEMEEENDR